MTCSNGHFTLKKEGGSYERVLQAYDFAGSSIVLLVGFLFACVLCAAENDYHELRRLLSCHP
jgi:hypothetical protein